MEMPESTRRQEKPTASETPSESAAFMIFLGSVPLVTSSTCFVSR